MYYCRFHEPQHAAFHVTIIAIKLKIHVCISGWQARWFILDNGILSYYKSEEDVVSGCKGSIKVSACDIVGEYLKKTIHHTNGPINFRPP